jgi:hypothetical protein
MAAVLIVAAVVAVFIWYLTLTGPIDEAPLNPAPAPPSPQPGVPVRPHPTDGSDLPFDQDAAQLVAETEAYLRSAS